MGEIPSRFAGDEPVDDPAGGGDEAEVRGEEDEEQVAAERKTPVRKPEVSVEIEPGKGPEPK
jgi:hypothetical protein